MVSCLADFSIKLIICPLFCASDVIFSRWLMFFKYLLSFLKKVFGKIMIKRVRGHDPRDRLEKAEIFFNYVEFAMNSSFNTKIKIVNFHSVSSTI